MASSSAAPAALWRYDYRCPRCAFTFEERRTRFTFKHPARCPECDGEAAHQPNFGGTVIYMSGKLGYDESRRLALGDKTERDMAHMPDGYGIERVDSEGENIGH